MTAWTRPYDDPLRVVIGTFASIGSSIVAFGALFIASHLSTLGVVHLLVFEAGWLAPSAVWLTLAWRLHRTALLVGSPGVRLRWLLRTRTIAWADIVGFGTVQELPFGIGPGGTTQRLIVILTGGRRARTPVQLVRRRLFGSTVHDGGSTLPPAQYERLLELLRGQLASTIVDRA